MGTPSAFPATFECGLVSKLPDRFGYRPHRWQTSPVDTHSTTANAARRNENCAITATQDLSWLTDFFDESLSPILRNLLKTKKRPKNSAYKLPAIFDPLPVHCFCLLLILFAENFPLSHCCKTSFLVLSASGGVAALRGNWIMKVAVASIQA